ncbi:PECTINESTERASE INHIBITOR-LIKE [Salix koriyanagi]|uniref:PECTINESTERASE INHIBITOR-LIKE n=1 Tax=Salix koriyanagi TaxID=2511006 RepID=A0A9Q0P7H7_9ROSI|nr:PECTINESTERASE INHIBITOR-LIKE [Salix koriyanagi]
MGSFHGHIPFFFVVVLVLSSNHILVDAHNDTTSRIKVEADFKVIAEIAGNTAIPNTDFKSLARLSLTNAIASCNAIHSHINTLLKISNSYTGRCLTGCSTNYEDAVGLITKSLAALDARDYGGAKKLISDALANATKCEDRFQELLQINSPFTLMKLKFSRLCLIGYKTHQSVDPKGTLDNCSCSGHYQTAIEKIKESLPALECKRYGDARAWVGAAINWSETCEGVLAGKSNKKSPLTPMKSEFTKQAALALSVIYKLAGN